MSASVQTISLARLAIVLLPVLIVVAILYRWSVNGKTAVYALARMLIQLLLIGYVLAFIFDSKNSLVVIGVLSVMLLTASWIALRPLQKKDPRIYGHALAAIATGGVPTLAIVTQLVLNVEPWYLPSKVIPLAGMIFANSMNSVSLAAERVQSEMGRGVNYTDARQTALNAAMIPLINSLFAVGLVSLPGMMTGQILSGVPPLIAVRYQTMVMCMVFGASGISAATYLTLCAKQHESTVADSPEQ